MLSFFSICDKDSPGGIGILKLNKKKSIENVEKIADDVAEIDKDLQSCDRKHRGQNFRRDLSWFFSASDFSLKQ